MYGRFRPRRRCGLLCAGCSVFEFGDFFFGGSRVVARFRKRFERGVQGFAKSYQLVFVRLNLHLVACHNTPQLSKILLNLGVHASLVANGASHLRNLAERLTERGLRGGALAKRVVMRALDHLLDVRIVRDRVLPCCLQAVQMRVRVMQLCPIRFLG